MLSVAVVPAASATTVGNHQVTVSCNGNPDQTSYGVSVAHRSRGQIKFTQVITNPDASTNVAMVSKPSGKRTGYQTVKDGGTVTWNPVLAGTYFPRIYRTGPSNCNGIFPGNGNYNLTYKITFNG